MNKKANGFSSLFIIVAAILAALLATAGLWLMFNYSFSFSKNNENKTAENKIVDWQTYTNNEYGFEIKYPADWVNCNVSGNYLLGIIPPINPSIIPNGMSFETYRGYSCGYGSFQIIKEEKKYAEISDVKDHYWNLYKKNECKPELMIKETSFNGQPALQVGSCDPSGEYAGTSIFFMHKQRIINIAFSSVLPEKLVQQILLTFNFTK